MKTVAFTIAEVKKGMNPAPVYQATFQDLTWARMSFWSKTGKPIDYDRGRALLECVHKKRVIHGVVDIAGQLTTDPFFGGQVQTKQPKRTIKQAEKIIALLIDGDAKAIDDAKAFLRAA